MPIDETRLTSLRELIDQRAEIDRRIQALGVEIAQPQEPHLKQTPLIPAISPSAALQKACDKVLGLLKKGEYTHSEIGMVLTMPRGITLDTALSTLRAQRLIVETPSGSELWRFSYKLAEAESSDEHEKPATNAPEVIYGEIYDTSASDKVSIRDALWSFLRKHGRKTRSQLLAQFDLPPDRSLDEVLSKSLESGDVALKDDHYYALNGTDREEFHIASVDASLTGDSDGFCRNSPRPQRHDFDTPAQEEVITKAIMRLLAYGEEWCTEDVAKRLRDDAQVTLHETDEALRLLVKRGDLEILPGALEDEDIYRQTPKARAEARETEKPATASKPVTKGPTSRDAIIDLLTKAGKRGAYHYEIVESLKNAYSQSLVILSLANMAADKLIDARVSQTLDYYKYWMPESQPPHSAAAPSALARTEQVEEAARAVLASYKDMPIWQFNREMLKAGYSGNEIARVRDDLCALGELFELEGELCYRPRSGKGPKKDARGRPYSDAPTKAKASAPAGPPPKALRGFLGGSDPVLEPLEEFETVLEIDDERPAKWSSRKASPRRGSGRKKGKGAGSRRGRASARASQPSPKPRNGRKKPSSAKRSRV